MRADQQADAVRDWLRQVCGGPAKVYIQRIGGFLMSESVKDKRLRRREKRILRAIAGFQKGKKKRIKSKARSVYEDRGVLVI